jgi:hypothetical protein
VFTRDTFTIKIRCRDLTKTVGLNSEEKFQTLEKVEDISEKITKIHHSFTGCKKNFRKVAIKVFSWVAEAKKVAIWQPSLNVYIVYIVRRKSFRKSLYQASGFSSIETHALMFLHKIYEKIFIPNSPHYDVLQNFPFFHKKSGNQSGALCMEN